MDKTKLKHISSLVYDLIERQVASQDKNTEYQEKFENLTFDLERLIEEAKGLAEDYKSQGLNFNTIEAEGFLRAMLTVKATIENYK
jgi:hypothetical protein